MGLHKRCSYCLPSQTIYLVPPGPVPLLQPVSFPVVVFQKSVPKPPKVGFIEVSEVYSEEEMFAL